MRLATGQLFAIRYCDQCNRRMNLIEDYVDDESTCKFCRIADGDA